MTSPRARAQAPIRTVIAGVDAHKDTHHVVVLTGLGQRLADRAFPATIAGYADLRDRVGSHGPIRCFAMESTGSYSAALTRYLIGTGADVVEVNRPHPRTRSRVGKDDAIDLDPSAIADIGDFGRIPLIPVSMFKRPDAHLLLTCPLSEIENEIRSTGTSGIPS